MHLKDLKDLKDLKSTDLLRSVGLEPQRGAADHLLPALGIFGAGVLVGVGIGLLLAPKPGRDTRNDVRRVAGRAAERFRDLGHLRPDLVEDDAGT